MANVRAIDIMFLDEIFDMQGGYVLNFSDRSMAQFFADELNIDIGDPRYSREGGSKAKRLRCFLKTVDADTAVKTLNALWEYREACRSRIGQDEKVDNAIGRFLALINRIQGNVTASAVEQPIPAFDRVKTQKLLKSFGDLALIDPHPRGIAFENFLKELFDFYGLQGREAFRLKNEQIDGSFVLGHETYLLEAKWHGPKIGNYCLHAFHGKIEQKASWTRGLFVSYSGFTDEGLASFGQGKRVICMDGLDLHDTLKRELPLNIVLEKKIRHAAETGEAFASVRNLFR